MCRFLSTWILYIDSFQIFFPIVNFQSFKSFALVWISDWTVSKLRLLLGPTAKPPNEPNCINKSHVITVALLIGQNCLGAEQQNQNRNFLCREHEVTRSEDRIVIAIIIVWSFNMFAWGDVYVLITLPFLINRSINRCPIAAHLAQDAARPAASFVHETEDGKVPAVELTHQRVQLWHHQRRRGQRGPVLWVRGQRSHNFQLFISHRGRYHVQPVRVLTSGDGRSGWRMAPSSWNSLQPSGTWGGFLPPSASSSFCAKSLLSLWSVSWVLS